jgi:hypothetical protein
MVFILIIKCCSLQLWKDNQEIYCDQMNQVWRHDYSYDSRTVLLVQIFNENQVEWGNKDVLVLLPIELR